MHKTCFIPALRAVRTPALMVCVLSLAACATAPNGPDVLVLPGTGKNLAQFHHDDAGCRSHALVQSGSAHASTDAAGVRTAALGALAGAAIGAAGGNGNSAATGAAVGLGLGAVAGASRDSGWSAQTRYDNAYIQCMYAQGHRVPVSASMAAAMPVGSTVSRPLNIPPPPPGAPPAPPPGYGKR